VACGLWAGRWQRGKREKEAGHGTGGVTSGACP
jgi:hypothetical protein